MNIKLFFSTITLNVFSEFLLLKKILLFSLFLVFSLNLFSVNQFDSKVKDKLKENILKFSDEILIELNQAKKKYDFLIKSVNTFISDLAHSRSSVLDSVNLEEFQKKLYDKVYNKDLINKNQLEETFSNFLSRIESSNKNEPSILNTSSNLNNSVDDGSDSAKSFAIGYKTVSSLLLVVFASGFYFNKKHKESKHEKNDEFVKTNFAGLDIGKKDSNFVSDAHNRDDSLINPYISNIDDLNYGKDNCDIFDSSIDNVNDYIINQSDDIFEESDDIENVTRYELLSDCDDFECLYKKSSSGRKLVPSKFAKELHENIEGSRKVDRLNLEKVYGKRSLENK